MVYFIFIVSVGGQGMMSFSPAVVSGTENLFIIYFGEMAVCSVCPIGPRSEFPTGVPAVAQKL